MFSTKSWFSSPARAALPWSTVKGASYIPLVHLLPPRVLLHHQQLKDLDIHQNRRMVCAQANYWRDDTWDALYVAFQPILRSCQTTAAALRPHCLVTVVFFCRLEVKNNHWEKSWQIIREDCLFNFPFQLKPPDFTPYFGSGDVWFGSRRATTQVLGKVFVPKREYCGEDQCSVYFGRCRGN